MATKKTKVTTVVQPTRKIVLASDFDAYFKTMFSFKTKAEAEAYQAEHEVEEGYFGHLLECLGRYKHNFDSLQKASNLELAQRYHNLLLTRLVLRQDATGVDATSAEKEQTFRLYEQKAQAIDNGQIAKDEIAYLDSLPAVNVWGSHSFTLDEICAYYYPNELGVKLNNVNSKVAELEAALSKSLDKYPEANRAKVRNLREQMLPLLLNKHGNNRQKALEELLQSSL